MLADGREVLVTARVETDGGELAALLEVAIAPTPLGTTTGSRSTRRELPADRGAGAEGALPNGLPRRSSLLSHGDASKR